MKPLEHVTKSLQWILGLTLGLAATSVAFGAEPPEPISTDRPDFVESSLTVGTNRFQIETSAGFERFGTGSARIRSQSTPTLLRFGITPTWELRLETDGYTSVRAGGKGASDLAVGAKWHTQDGKGNRPSVGWLFHFDLPTGSREFRGRGVRPSVRNVLEWELGQAFSLGVMPGITFDNSDETGHFVSGIFAVVAGKSWTDRFRTFIEVSGQELRAQKHGGSITTFDAGAAFLVNHDVQLDTVLSWGLTRNTPGFFLGLGFSRRF